MIVVQLGCYKWRGIESRYILEEMLLVLDSELDIGMEKARHESRA